MHDEVLTPNAAALLPALAKFGGFYLAGGTALALQIGHRRSVDFDLFSTEPLPKHLLEQIKRVAPNSITLTYRSPEQLNLLIHEVKTIFLFFNYPVINPLLS